MIRQVNVKFTTYNVENLFDGVDDPFKDDGPAKPEKEKIALANVLKSLNSDVIALQEVENKEIIQEVLTLAGMKDRYNIIVGKSDGRGIACALLIDKKYPIKKYSINEGESTFYRPPVEAVIELSPGFNIKIYSVHFKAKMDPHSQEQRKKEAKRLIELARKENVATVIMGDFNDLPSSEVSELFESNGFTDVRKIDKLSKDVDTPTHFSTENIEKNLDFPQEESFDIEEEKSKIKPSILDYIRISYDLKSYIIQGSFDVLEKNENPNVLLASDHRPISVSFYVN